MIKRLIRGNCHSCLPLDDGYLEVVFACCIAIGIIGITMYVVYLH